MVDVGNGFVYFLKKQNPKGFLKPFRLEWVENIFPIVIGRTDDLYVASLYINKVENIAPIAIGRTDDL